MRRLLVLLVAILAAWLGTAAPAMAATQGTSNLEPIHFYTYNCDHDSLQGTGTTQRGPPTHTHALNTKYGTVDGCSRGPSARPETDDAVSATTYTPVEAAVRDTGNTTTTREQVRRTGRGISPPHPEQGAANGGSKIPWTSWQNYPKVTQGGREYAQAGDRLYTRHAVDRLQPSGLGAPAGTTGAGRGISPNFVEDVLGSTTGAAVKGPNGEARLSFTSGSVQVITENNIVITVITR